MIAVYDNEVHDKINDFCAKSRIPANGTSYNQILVVDPAHLIRMSVGVGFKRARLLFCKKARFLNRKQTSLVPDFFNMLSLKLMRISVHQSGGGSDLNVYFLLKLIPS